MRIVFMGNPAFAVPSLDILVAHRCGVQAVVTAPDKPRGRGQHVAPTPIRISADHYHLPVLQPENLLDLEFLGSLKEYGPDLIVVVAFRILPREVFTMPTLGSFNLHASLLPRYRGAAPINWALINGDSETGVTTFVLKEKVDTGSIILQRRVAIGPDETAGELHDRLARVGAETVLDTVRMFDQHAVHPRLQGTEGISAAPKIFKDQCRINWREPARSIHNFVRGLSPAPTAWTTYGTSTIRVFRTAVVDSNGPTATWDVGELVHVDDERILVGTGERLLSILELQREGRGRLSVGEFLRGYKFERRARFV